MTAIEIDNTLFGIVDYGLGAETLIVLVQDNDKPERMPMWKCPGGRSEESDKSSESALVRELLEELTIKTEPRVEMYRVNYTSHSDAWWLVKPLEPKESIRPGKEIGFILLATKSECLSLIANECILPAHAHALKEYLNRFTL